MSELVKEDIEARVDDWVQRIKSIFFLVKDTLSDTSGVEFVEIKTTLMHEELMQKFEVSSISLPVLEVKHRGMLVASFKPLGLWVIGANGRIDILTKEGAYILIDLEGKEKPSNWRVYSPKNRKESIPFNKEFILGLV